MSKIATSMQQVEVLCGRASERILMKADQRSKKMAKSTVWLIVLFAIFSVVACIDDKCSACNAVAGELELQLLKEKPRNHLDMRNRLNSEGKREGKVIDYRVSELRAVELLDGLCERMHDYTLEKVDSTKRSWVLVDDFDNLTNKQEAMAHANDISTYCGRLLEETEDELTELIKKGSLQVGEVRKALCQTLSNHCGKKREAYSTDDESSGVGSDEL